MNKHIFTSLLSLFVIVGFTSFINPHTVSAQPIEWEEFDLSPDNYNSIAYGNGVYVVVGDEASMYSSDGKNWYPAMTSLAGVLYSVVYGDGKFVAVGSSNNTSTSNPVAYTSTDGVIWSPSFEALPPKVNTGAGLKKVSYVYDNINEKNLFVAVGSDLSNLLGGSQIPYIIYSSNGNEWFKATLPMGVNGTASDLTGGYNEDGEVVFLSSVATNPLLSSSNIIMSTNGGANWFYPDDALTGLDGFSGAAMSYLNGEFFLGGTISDMGSKLIYVMSSSDGFNWEQHEVGSTVSFFPRFNFAYGNDNYISIGAEESIYSLGGENWEFFTPSFDKSTDFGVYPIQLIYADDSFVLLGQNELGESIVAFPKRLNDSSEGLSSKSSSIFGTRFCSAGVTTFCRPQNGFVNNNPLISIYTELLGLYQQLLSAMQSENSL
ncbi:MAG: hypothetical protein PHC89_01515 [Candidatus Pacebacteria bacterium]|nr:hypothetical protein [Candidatus Paceibacterota bacterium]